MHELNEVPFGDTEKDQEITFLVTIKTYGNRKAALRSATTGLCVGLNRAFAKTDVYLLSPEEAAKVKWGNIHMTRVIFDPKAHDGNHDGHEKPVEFIPPRHTSGTFK